jgi:hypothetical protein
MSKTFFSRFSLKGGSRKIKSKLDKLFSSDVIKPFKGE